MVEGRYGNSVSNVIYRRKCKEKKYLHAAYDEGIARNGTEKASRNNYLLKFQQSAMGYMSCYEEF